MFLLSLIIYFYYIILLIINEYDKNWQIFILQIKTYLKIKDNSYVFIILSKIYLFESFN